MYIDCTADGASARFGPQCGATGKSARLRHQTDISRGEMVSADKV